MTRRRITRRPEEDLQRAVAQLLSLYEGRRLLKFCHVPNGGWRTKAEAGVLKAMGAKPGVPDLLVWTTRGHFQIELKAPAGRLSDNQAEWAIDIQHFGVPVHVCRSVDQVIAVLTKEGLPSLVKSGAERQYGQEAA